LVLVQTEDSLSNYADYLLTSDIPTSPRVLFTMTHDMTSLTTN